MGENTLQGGTSWWQSMKKKIIGTPEQRQASKNQLMFMMGLHNKWMRRMMIPMCCVIAYLLYDIQRMERDFADQEKAKHLYREAKAKHKLTTLDEEKLAKLEHLRKMEQITASVLSQSPSNDTTSKNGTK